MSDHAAFVAAAGLDADTHDPSFREFGSQKPPTDWCVVELPAFVRPWTAMSSLALHVSIPAVVVITCVIFVDPAL